MRSRKALVCLSTQEQAPPHGTDIRTACTLHCVAMATPRAYNSNKMAAAEVEKVLCLAREETGEGHTPSKELITKGKYFCGFIHGGQREVDIL